MARKKKNQTPPPAPEQGSEGSARRRGRPIPLWQRALLAASVLLMLGGGAAWAYSKFTRTGDAARQADRPGGATASESPGGGPSPTDSGVSGFGPAGVPAPGGDGPRTTGSPGTADSPGDGGERAIDVYSPAVFRLGFSFFAGFAMAYALRQFVKITLLIAGVVLLGLFGLQYAGLIQIDWAAIEGKYDSIAAFFREQTGSFTKFVSGYLPSATSAAAGAVIGFRKK